MTLTAYILGVMMSLPGVRPEAEGRLRAVAADIATVVEDPDEAQPFEDHKRSALALVAVAYHESGLRRDVQHCKVNGDAGRSITLWQLMRGRSWEGHTRERLCADNLAATRAALHTLMRARTADLAGRLRGYTSGSAAVDNRAAREMLAIYWTLARRHLPQGDA